MKQNVVFPFRTLLGTEDVLAVEDWYRRSSDVSEITRVNEKSGIKGWGYNIPLILGRQIYFNPATACTELDVEVSNPVFELIVSIKTGVIGHRRVEKRLEFQPGDDGDVTIELQLESHELCEYITLVTTLVLKNDLTGAPRWAPDKKGSRLWEDEVRVPIEGSGARFSIRNMKFSEHHRLPAEANWYLDWNPSLTHYSFNSVTTLVVNSEKTDFVKSFLGCNEILLGEIMGSVICEICTCLLVQENFREPEGRFPDGSLGETAAFWLNSAFPDEPLAQVEQKYLRTPDLVHVKLRALAAQL